MKKKPNKTLKSFCRLVWEETTQRHWTAFLVGFFFSRCFESTAVTLCCDRGDFFFSFSFSVQRLCKSNWQRKIIMIGTPCFVPSVPAHADRGEATAAERQVAESRARAESEAPPGRRDRAKEEPGASVNRKQTRPAQRAAAKAAASLNFPGAENTNSRCRHGFRSSSSSYPSSCTSSFVIVPPPARLLIKLSLGF